MSQELEKAPEQGSFTPAGFDHAQRVAKMLSSSDLIPKEYKGNVQNTLIALEIANRIGASPLMVMQNLYVVHGKPSWGSSFIIAAINGCGRFEPLLFELTGIGDDLACYAWTYLKGKMDKVVGPTVTMKMAKAEGWVDKNGSKWKTMPELMIRYRSAAFFGRLYAPEILMGMQTMEEVIDVEAVPVQVNKEEERIKLMIGDAKTIEDLEKIQDAIPFEQMELFMDKKKQLAG